MRRFSPRTYPALHYFSEAREKFGEPLASALAEDGLIEAVAAPRSFALVERQTVPDEPDPAITTETIRLHRLVRESRRRGQQARRAKWLRALVAAMAAVYPAGVSNDPKSWPRARRLDALVLALVGGDGPPPKDAEEQAADLLNQLGSHTGMERSRPMDRRGRFTSGRWRSVRRCSAPSIPLRPTWLACLTLKATMKGRGRFTSGRWRSSRRCWERASLDGHQPQQLRWLA